jgi:hypothetical protein
VIMNSVAHAMGYWVTLVSDLYSYYGYLAPRVVFPEALVMQNAPIVILNLWCCTGSSCCGILSRPDPYAVSSYRIVSCSTALWVPRSTLSTPHSVPSHQCHLRMLGRFLGCISHMIWPSQSTVKSMSKNF